MDIKTACKSMQETSEQFINAPNRPPDIETLIIARQTILAHMLNVLDAKLDTLLKRTNGQ